MLQPSLALFLVVSFSAASAQTQSKSVAGGAKRAAPSASQVAVDGVKAAAPPAPQVTVDGVKVVAPPASQVTADGVKAAAPPALQVTADGVKNAATPAPQITVDGVKTAAPPPPQAVVEGVKAAAPPPPQAAKPDLSLEMRGDIFMARKMYREAVDTFRSGNQTDPVLLNKTGIAYHQMMQLDNARKSYEQALRLKRDYVEAMNNLGTVYYARKSYRRAIGWYERALKLAPHESKSSSIYMNLGTALFARKKYEDAAKAYQTAMQLDPEVFERHGNFGVMLEERTVEERAKYHFFLAKLYAKQSRNELAIQYLRKSIEEGLKDKAKMLADPEFAALKDLPEFQLLLTLEPRIL